jgi:hypothetical protein
MANNLKLSYTDVYSKVGKFLGIQSLTATADITKCKNITLRGYRQALMPVDLSTGKPYRWKFLERITTLSTVADTDEYKLPDGFSSLINPFTHTTPQAFNPVSTSLGYIYQKKSVSTATGPPRYYALKIGEYDEIKGQQDSVVFWPTPSGVYTYYYTYLLTPSPPVNNDDYFVGDAYFSECILESALSVAELEKEDKEGAHTQKAERLIQFAIGEEKRNYLITELGMMSDGGAERQPYYATLTNVDGEQVLPLE